MSKREFLDKTTVYIPDKGRVHRLVSPMRRLQQVGPTFTQAEAALYQKLREGLDVNDALDAVLAKRPKPAEDKAERPANVVPMNRQQRRVLAAQSRDSGEHKERPGNINSQLSDQLAKWRKS